MSPIRNILFMMSGSIACAKASGLVSEWKKQGHEVRIATTRSVQQFVGHATLEGLSGEPVFGDAFEPGRVMDHIELARWADLVVVCPATSNLLAKLAAGIADDAVTSLWQATWGRGAPQFIVPAMNTRMWNYPATREALERLSSWGIHVLPTAEGDLACGESGAGRMLEVKEIRSRIEALVDFDAPLSSKRGRVLITGGGTREPIDSVRFIGNHSTGRTASNLADAFRDAGHEVTWLGGDGAMEPGPGIEKERYSSFEDLDRQIARLLGTRDFDLVIHAAAVSDFSVAGVEGGNGKKKLSSAGEVTLRLKPNPKILGRLRDYSRNPAIRVIGFKLTVGADEGQAGDAVVRQLEAFGTDAVVHNDLTDITEHSHPFTLHLPATTGLRYTSSADLAAGLVELMEEGA